MGKNKIMIIDDDKKFLDQFNDILTLSGYDVVIVSDALAVLDVATRAKPDVILLDLKMPKKSGFQIAEELRNFSELNNVPIVAITGFFKEENVPLMSLCGIKRCIKKPLYPLDVIAQIEGALAEKNT